MNRFENLDSGKRKSNDDLIRREIVVVVFYDRFVDLLSFFMPSIRQYSIRVPGTSANLGSGFDLFGLAFRVYNRFQFQFIPERGFKTSVKGMETLPFDPDEDLVLFSYQSYFRRFLPGVEPRPYSLLMDLELPIKGGLGSSASAAVAGVCAARFAHQNFYSMIPLPKENEFLFHLGQIEGHPDNTIPAYLGGFVFAYFNGNRLEYVKKKFPKKIRCFLIVPNLETSTHQSRKTLPGSYSTEDVIFNMGRIATWMEFLDSGKISLLKLALEDRIHTPYRMHSGFELNPLLAEISKNLIGHSLSGSGPSVLLFSERNKAIRIEKILKEKVAEFVQKTHFDCQLLSLKVEEDGILESWKNIQIL
ncbi:homoserine kinase [Leptospira borgpetersenii serovar Hardjo-bovis]|uniref:Homoserine kinase n=2 Tax=Leptospira borgpetersenii serovar Hardjo-bovis TaxID=338217 RepID=M6BLE2_LEPBO|nr:MULTISPECIES: homoserine kinase [Leptospira]EMJ80537.1 homoserine kinase [Leptospira borgpetersenii serovar Hardjo-bovis str. Sponselee]MBE8349236.1 homoserine kinase [Leptospira borgpetersenii serovar Hardjo-bovis]MBE8359650.1 homoserine kinase [Leptospira borgpetersenii serovar Hardjo-bovis]MBE8362529.1 homoserine kinase [Leptospira borgpetersenii serovar Balcanica]MBE8368820.1 homoserine kinase [Leptospira borgpetersenii serovar Balcanica]